MAVKHFLLKLKVPTFSPPLLFDSLTETDYYSFLLNIYPMDFDVDFCLSLKFKYFILFLQ